MAKFDTYQTDDGITITVVHNPMFDGPRSKTPPHNCLEVGDHRYHYRGKDGKSNAQKFLLRQVGREADAAIDQLDSLLNSEGVVPASDKTELSNEEPGQDKATGLTAIAPV